MYYTRICHVIALWIRNYLQPGRLIGQRLGKSQKGSRSSSMASCSDTTEAYDTFYSQFANDTSSSSSSSQTAREPPSTAAPIPTSSSLKKTTTDTAMKSAAKLVQYLEASPTPCRYHTLSIIRSQLSVEC